MADIIMDGTTYSGSPTNTATPQRPKTIVRRVKKIGRLVLGMEGTTSWVHRAIKREWAIDWGNKANQTTQTAVIALVGLTAPFTYRDVTGLAFSVVIVGDDAYEEAITTDAANAYKYGLKLVVREV